MRKIAFYLHFLKKVWATPKVSGAVKVRVKMSPHFIISFSKDLEELWSDSFADAGGPPEDGVQNNKA